MVMAEFIFRNRGLLLVPAGLLIIILGRPNMASFVAGLLVVALGEAIRIWGVGYTGVTTRAAEVQAPELVTAGPYAYVRNPLYIGNFFIGTGFCIMVLGRMDNFWLKILLFVVFWAFFAFIYNTIVPLEEKYLRENFKEYSDYEKDVPRWIPNGKRYKKCNGVYSWNVILKAESRTLIQHIIACIIIVVKMVYF